MGRQQTLMRLAFGRSAFQDPESPVASSYTQQEGEADHLQQYDAKGRPVNPKTEDFNAELRKAQNEVLELVGVVERKDRSDRADELRTQLSRKHRQSLLEDEHDKGENFEWMYMLVNFVASLPAKCILQRVQIGLYDPSRSMSDVLIAEHQAMFTGGFWRSLATRFPGSLDIVTHTLVRWFCSYGIEELADRVQLLIGARCRDRKKKAWLLSAVKTVSKVMLLSIDVALLPIELQFNAKRLGLAPPDSYLLSWSTFRWWHIEIFRGYKWLPLLGVVCMHTLKSCWSFFWPKHQDSFQVGWLSLFGLSMSTSRNCPAAMLLLHEVVHYDAEEEDYIPIGSLFTPFRYPAITDQPTSSQLTQLPRPSAATDPLGWILYHTWSARTKILHWCGWNVVKISTRPREDHFENDTTLDWDYDDLETKPPPVHRSTMLAHLTAHNLALAADKIFTRMMVLPFESIMLRSLAQTFMASPIATKTPAAIAASPRLYTPENGGPLGALLRSPRSAASWSHAGSYLNKLGLSLCLMTSIDTFLFFSIYKSTKYVGTTYYGWGETEEERERRRSRLLSDASTIGSNASAS